MQFSNDYFSDPFKIMSDKREPFLSKSIPERCLRCSFRGGKSLSLLCSLCYFCFNKQHLQRSFKVNVLQVLASVHRQCMHMLNFVDVLSFMPIFVVTLVYIRECKRATPEPLDCVMSIVFHCQCMLVVCRLLKSTVVFAKYFHACAQRRCLHFHSILDDCVSSLEPCDVRVLKMDNPEL